MSGIIIKNKLYTPIYFINIDFMILTLNYKCILFFFLIIHYTFIIFINNNNIKM